MSLSIIDKSKRDYQKALEMLELTRKPTSGFNATIFQKIALTCLQLKLGYDIKAAEIGQNTTFMLLNLFYKTSPKIHY